MKKMFITATLFLGLLPSLSYAINPCGLLCRNAAAPYFESCKSSLNNCLSSILRSDLEAVNQCHQKNDICVNEAKAFQLNCVERCLNGELP